MAGDPGVEGVETLRADDPIAVALVEAIRSGAVEALGVLLDERPGLARASLADESCALTRTTLHIVTDWPGHVPRGAESVRLLVGAGADVNARCIGPSPETPLHWAASSDDVAVLDALLDTGADMEADGGVIAGGTPLADAVAFGQWRAARRLVDRGAQVPLREAAALGLTDRVDSLWMNAVKPTVDEVSGAFWYACHGGQLPSAEMLLGRGADLDWVSPWDELTPLDAARRSGAEHVVEWLHRRGARSSKTSP